MRRFVPVLIAHLTLLYIPSGVRAQGTSAPSLADTLKFIEDKIAGYRTSEYLVQGTGEYVTFDGTSHPNVLLFGVREAVSHQYIQASFKGGCDMSLHIVIYRKWNNVDKSGWGKDWKGRSKTEWEMQLPLKKMSSAGIKVIEYDLHAETRAAVKQATTGSQLNVTTLNEGQKFVDLVLPMAAGEKLEMTKTVDGKEETLVSDAENLLVENAELANRLAKAFGHAMTLCGAKDDPF